MNSLCFKLSTRVFHVSSVLDKVSTQAKFMIKIMGGTNKKKAHRFFLDDQPSSILPDFLGPTPSSRNTKVASRRAAVLNSVFLERITEILSSSDVDNFVRQYGFLVTKVKYASDGTALHVYWCSDSAVNLVEEKLPQIGGRLRHELSQLQNGKVPHINFIYDRSTYKATDVDELLKIADFGSDYVPPHEGTLQANTYTRKEGDVKEQEKLVKCSDLLGIDRDAIINQVKRSMHHISEPTHAKPSNYSCDIQRRIDFKKYLHAQAILRTKMERRKTHENERNVDLASFIRKRDTFLDDDMFEEEDVIDEEVEEDELKR